MEYRQKKTGMTHSRPELAAALSTAYAKQSYSECEVNFLTYIPENPGAVFGCAIRKIMSEDKSWH
jgi:hypothetical protein